MSATDLPYALHGLLISAALLLWFHLGWKRYAIDKGRDDILSLRCDWWDLVVSRPEWRQNVACRAFTRLLEELAESLPKYSLGLVMTIWLTGFRLGSSSVSELVIANLPDSQLRMRARSTLDAALLAVGMTMLRQSIFVLSLAMLILPVALIAVLAVMVARQGARGLASVPVVVASAMRRFSSPALTCVLVVGVDTSVRELSAMKGITPCLARHGSREIQEFAQ